MEGMGMRDGREGWKGRDGEVSKMGMQEEKRR